MKNEWVNVKKIIMDYCEPVLWGSFERWIFEVSDAERCNSRELDLTDSQNNREFDSSGNKKI